jgi:hypothetical protein
MEPSEIPAGPAAASARFSPGLARLWLGVLLPPAAWVTDLLARYMAIRYANLHGRLWPLHVSTGIGLAMLLVGVTLCWRTRRTAIQHGNLQAGMEANAMATLSSWGLALALFFFLLIAAQAYPTLVLTVREIT